jgi:hypothetical protein
MEMEMKIRTTIGKIINGLPTEKQEADVNIKVHDSHIFVAHDGHWFTLRKEVVLSIAAYYEAKSNIPQKVAQVFADLLKDAATAAGPVGVPDKKSWTEKLEELKKVQQERGLK